MSPCSISQLLPTLNRLRSSRAHSTLSTSKSKEQTWVAPIRRPANEKRPLPQPTSRNVLPAKDSDPSISVRERSAWPIRDSSTSARNSHQVFTAKNRHFFLFFVV